MRKYSTITVLSSAVLIWLTGILSCEDPLYGPPDKSKVSVGLSGNKYEVGDTVEDFTMSICKNGSGTWTLYDYFHTQNGGDKKIILINCFATW